MFDIIPRRLQTWSVYRNFYQANCQSIAILPLLETTAVVCGTHTGQLTQLNLKKSKRLLLNYPQVWSENYSHLFSTGYSWQLDDSNKSYWYVEEYWLVIQLSPPPNYFYAPPGFRSSPFPQLSLVQTTDSYPDTPWVLLSWWCSPLELFTTAHHICQHSTRFQTFPKTFVSHYECLVYSYNPTCCIFSFPANLAFWT